MRLFRGALGASIIGVGAAITPIVIGPAAWERTAAAQEGVLPLAEPRDEARTFAAGGMSETAIVAALVGARLGQLQSVGTSAVTYQVDLAGPIDAAFKPESRLHPQGWLAEVAAYRIARELALDSVPPAVLRSVDRGQLRRRLDDNDLPVDLVVNDGVVRGAFIYWVPGLLRSDLDTPEGITRWQNWLRQDGAIPEDDRIIARDLSNMLVFDYLIGNRDRFSGGNLKPAEGGRIIIRDHNLAFPFTLSGSAHERLLETLMRTQRFSRTTIERLVAMNEEALRAATADENPANLLDNRQLAGVMDRRATILSYVGAMVEAFGEEDVLYFH
jgi:hypothetical protein